MVRNRVSAALAAVMGTAVFAGAAMAQSAPVVVGGSDGNTAAGVAVPAQAASPEAVLWELARRQGTTDAYRGYLSVYPSGQYAPEARAILGQLMAGTPVGSVLGSAQPPVTQPPAAQPTPVQPAPELPPNTSPAAAARAEAAGTGIAGMATAPATEAALGLSQEERIGIQRGLVKAGYDTRGVDGQFGSGTRRALSAWQQSRGYPATGYLNAAQAEELRISGRQGGGETPATLNASAVEAALNLTPTQVRIIQSRLTQMGHDTNGVDGKFGSGSRRAITAWQRGAGVAATGYLTRADADAILNAGTTPVVVPGTVDADSAAKVELALGLSRDDRIAVQRGLVAAGHDTRGLDGQFGSGTRRAIRAWQVSRGETATGYLTRTQSDVLRGAVPVVTPAPAPSAAGGATAVDEARLDLGPIARAEVQSRLAALGYDPRGVDGKFGSGTRAAIRKWQGDNGLAVSGYLNSAQLTSLRDQRRN